MAISQTSLPMRRKVNPTQLVPASSTTQNDDIITTEKETVEPPPQATPTSDRVDRSSFSSFRETHDGTAQSFTDSKTSSYLRNEIFNIQNNEDAIVDDYSATSSSGTRTPEVLPQQEARGIMRGMLTNPQSNLFVSPCDGFRGWKDIPLMTPTINVKSKSYSDLARLYRGFQWEVANDDAMDLDVVDEPMTGIPQAGKSRLEMLPTELLGSIIDHLVLDIPPNGFTTRNTDLMSLLLTSKALHSATLATIYDKVTIPHSRIFAKFLAQIAAYPSLGTIVRRLDFSHFNPTGAGMTARERYQTLNLIPETLLRCLSLTPNLREFLAQEHIDDDLSSEVLKVLFCDLPRMKALDFCACSSAKFRDAFTCFLSRPNVLPQQSSITRLSLHECTILPSSVYETLLPHLTHLTHLDVAHTKITASALHSIPYTARFTHLNLSKCSNLSGSSVVGFIANHPAAQSLVYLNLGMDPKSSEMLPSRTLTALLEVLPSTLKSLNLKGSKMDGSHIPLLLPLSKHVEELGLGRHLVLSDVERLFAPESSSSSNSESSTEPWIPSSLRYIDLSDLNSSDLDLSTLFGSRCPILKAVAEPLEVIEVGADVLKRLERSQSVLDRVGWCVKEAGRRAWMVRVRFEASKTTGNVFTGNSMASGISGGSGNQVAAKKVDDGSRDWKWGASYWGMRKIPVARAEVGGMYGHYMFKR